MDNRQYNITEMSVPKTLGEYKKTIWIFGQPQEIWIPMMNPQYLTENNLWDNDGAADTEEAY